MQEEEQGTVATEISETEGQKSTEGTKPGETPESGISQLDDEAKALRAERFARIAKREKELVNKELQLKNQRKELDEKIQTVKQFEDLRDASKKDPKRILETFGLTYDQLSKAILKGEEVEKAQPQLTPEEIAAKVREEIKREMDEEKEKTATQQKMDAALNNVYSEIEKELNAPDKYELTKIEGGKEAVFQVMLAAYQDQGKKITPAEAASLLENHLTEQVKTYVANPRVQQLLKEMGYSKAGVDEKDNSVHNGNEGLIASLKRENQRTLPTKTLTNDNSTAPTSTIAKRLSREDRIAQITQKYGA